MRPSITELFAALRVYGPLIGDDLVDAERRAAKQVLLRWCVAEANDRAGDEQATWHAAIDAVVRSLYARPLPASVVTPAQAAGYVRRLQRLRAIDVWRRENPGAARDRRVARAMWREANARHVTIDVIDRERAARRAAPAAGEAREAPLRSTLSEVDVAEGHRLYELHIAPDLDAAARQLVSLMVEHGGPAGARAALEAQGVQRATAQKRCARVREAIAAAIAALASAVDRRADDDDDHNHDDESSDGAAIDDDAIEELRAFLSSLRDRRPPRTASAGAAMLHQRIVALLTEQERARLAVLEEAQRADRALGVLSPSQHGDLAAVIRRARTLTAQHLSEDERRVVQKYLGLLHRILEGTRRP